MPNKTHCRFILILLAFIATACGSNVKFGTLPSATCVDAGFGCVTPAPISPKVQTVFASGLITKNSSCVMCHTKITGDVLGFGTVTFREDSFGRILGNVYAADEKIQRWNNNQLDSTFVDTISDPNLIFQVLPELRAFNLINRNDGSLAVKPGEKHNTFSNISFLQGGDLYSLTGNDPAKRQIAETHLIKDAAGKLPLIHESDFPNLDPLSCLDTSKGTITTADGAIYRTPLNGNEILVNGRVIANPDPNSPQNSFNDFDPSCPASKTLRLQGEVVIKGDLILSGCITGNGTIYATGNIYLPDDLKVLKSAYPFTGTIDETILKGEAFQKMNRDMISLGSSQFIVIGSLNEAIITNPTQDRIFSDNIGKFKNIYNWLASSSASAQNLYTNSFLKRPLPFLTTTPGAVSRIDANLYANLGIASTMVGSGDTAGALGTATNIVVNGSIMTPNLSMIGGSYFYNGRQSGINPFNGADFTESQINQDFRLKYTNAGYECLRLNGN